MHRRWSYLCFSICNTALKQHRPASAERKAESRSAEIAETAKTLSTSLFWSNTTYNLCLYAWQRSPNPASDEQTTVLGCFTAPPFKSCTSYRWGLARHGINKLVQAASADPTTEFCSTLSVSSSSWSWQKCIEWDHRVSQNSVRSLFWSCTTCNFRFWENDRTSGIVLFLQFHRIEQRHVGARSKIDWNHGSIWWTIIFHTWPWSSRQAVGIAKLFFPKPQQRCTWYSCTCKAWNKQAGSRSFCWPKHWVLFCSLNLLPLMILTRMY